MAMKNLRPVFRDQNTGTYELSLMDVDRDPISDLVLVEFREATSSDLIANFKNQTFPPPKSYKLPAFPQTGFMYSWVAPVRYRARASDFFQLIDKQVRTDSPIFFKNTRHWLSAFVPWPKLSLEIQPLKVVLMKSQRVRLLGGPSIGTFKEAAYDNVSSGRLMLAKAGLLNVYTKLRLVQAPSKGRDWFSYVEEVVVIDRERIVAVVQSEMADLIQQVRTNIEKYKDYRTAPAEHHFRNMPPELNVRKSSMCSIKTVEELGNLQLTVGRGKSLTGETIFVLDADIDENGKLMAHIADVFRHVFTGGTHPFDIYEYLRLVHGKVDVAYGLVPRTSQS